MHVTKSVESAYADNSLQKYLRKKCDQSTLTARYRVEGTMIGVKQGHHEPHGMVLAPASIAAATVGDAQSAVAWLQANFTSGLIKPPYNVRTETPTNNAGYFVTASGGYLQNLIFGFGGLRIDERGLVAAYAPPGWKSMTLRDIRFRGQHYDITVDRDAGGRVQLRPKALHSQRVQPGT